MRRAPPLLLANLRLRNVLKLLERPSVKFCIVALVVKMPW
jgi:hypothetical protein